MPDSPTAEMLTAERRYYQLVDAAGADIELLCFAIAFGIREAGMTTDHPHIRAMLDYCTAHETSRQAATVMATGAQHRHLGKTAHLGLH